jgi:hypothetical protein
MPPNWPKSANVAPPYTAAVARLGGIASGENDWTKTKKTKIIPYMLRVTWHNFPRRGRQGWCKYAISLRRVGVENQVQYQSMLPPGYAT